MGAMLSLPAMIERLPSGKFRLETLWRGYWDMRTRLSAVLLRPLQAMSTLLLWGRRIRNKKGFLLQLGLGIALSSCGTNEGS
jgi:hypothetical protein